MGTCQENYR